MSHHPWRSPMSGAGIPDGRVQTPVRPARSNAPEPPGRRRQCNCGATGYGGQFILDHARENCGKYCLEVCE